MTANHEVNMASYDTNKANASAAQWTQGELFTYTDSQSTDQEPKTQWTQGELFGDSSLDNKSNAQPAQPENKSDMSAELEKPRGAEETEESQESLRNTETKQVIGRVALGEKNSLIDRLRERKRDIVSNFTDYIKNWRAERQEDKSVLANARLHNDMGKYYEYLQAKEQRKAQQKEQRQAERQNKREARSQAEYQERIKKADDKLHGKIAWDQLQRQAEQRKEKESKRHAKEQEKIAKADTRLHGDAAYAAARTVTSLEPRVIRSTEHTDVPIVNIDYNDKSDNTMRETVADVPDISQKAEATVSQPESESESVTEAEKTIETKKVYTPDELRQRKTDIINNINMSPAQLRQALRQLGQDIHDSQIGSPDGFDAQTAVALFPSKDELALVKQHAQDYEKRQEALERDIAAMNEIIGEFKDRIIDDSLPDDDKAVLNDWFNDLVDRAQASGNKTLIDAISKGFGSQIAQEQPGEDKAQQSAETAETVSEFDQAA